jgi:GntR family transcriptional regulator
MLNNSKKIIRQSPKTNGSTLLYKQVKTDLIESLRKSEWRPGEALPSEAKLASKYGVGISTVRAAIAELTIANLLIKIQGKGTFVADHNSNSDIYRFFRLIRKDGEKILPVSKLVSFSKIPNSQKSNNQFNLSDKQKQLGFYKIKNILFVDDSPTIFSTILVPAYLFPGMTKATLLKGSSTLYSVYQKSFGITITRSSEQLVASTADALTVKNLKLNKGDSIIEINRLAYTFGGTLIEKRNSKVSTKLFYYEINEGEL